MAGFSFADTARLEGENRFLIELAYSDSVGTFNIVSMDLKLRSGIDLCLTG